MKKLVCLIFVLIVLIIGYYFIINNKHDYSVKYKFKKFDVVEKYYEDIDSYIISFNVNDNNYNFLIDHTYSNSRNIVEDIKLVDKDNNCYKVKTFDKYSDTICYNNEFYLLKEKEQESKLIHKYDNVLLYKKGNYFTWNNYGLSSILDKKKYNFLNNETYNNNLYYQFDKYIIFADYKTKRYFNKFYIFDSKGKKYSEFKFDYDISFDSYFMGDIDDYIYLYDKKNRTQYKINIDKQKIFIVSDKNGGQLYNKKWENVSYNKLNYNELIFSYNRKYNYFIKDNKLYLNFYNTNIDILISDKNILDIIKIDNSKVYYLVDNSIYCYELGKSENKIMENFEWNFNYNGKVFIFN